MRKREAEMSPLQQNIALKLGCFFVLLVQYNKQPPHYSNMEHSTTTISLSVWAVT